jgi:DNA-binding winged helix-turn-helix (wHTH) protein/tetratricopeptide (TPR) repeat protein
MEKTRRAGARLLYCFDAFELDSERHELRLGGAAVEMQPKVFGLLLYLVQNRHRAVSRDELFSALWPDVVVTDDALFHALKKARAAVGDDGAAQRVIATLPRVGYRFVAHVTEREAAAPAAGTGPAAGTLGAGLAALTPGPPLVGRAAELARLREALAAALAGQGRVVLVSGEAGIGKSRLAREIVEIAREAGSDVHEAASWHGAGAPPLWLWVQVLRAVAESWPAERLSRAMGAGAGEIARLVPELAEKLSISVPPVRDTDEARFLLMDAVVRFFVQAARTRAQIVLLEDLQWAPPATLELLSLLARSLGGARVLVVATVRDEALLPDAPLAEALAACEQRDALVRVPLSGLGAGEVGALVEQTAGFAPPPELSRALHTATAGNPFFVKEVVRLASEEPGGAEEMVARLASSADDLPGAERRMAPSSLPAGIRRVLERRIAALPPRARELLAAASVIGAELALAVLAQVVELARPELLDTIGGLLASDLVEVASERRTVYRFAHALVREAAYAGLREPERLRLHQRAAEALEALYEGRLEPVVPVLAHHYAEAAPLVGAAKAVEYAKRAGDLANLALSYEEAAWHYERALEAFELLPAPADLRRRSELLVCAGYARQMAGRFESGRAALREAAGLARQVGDANLLVLAAIGFAELAQGVSDPECVGLLLGAIGVSDDQPPFVRVWLRCMLAVDLANDRGRVADAQRIVGEADAIARESGGRHALGYVRCAQAFLLRVVSEGMPEERLELLREAEELTHDLGDRSFEAVLCQQLHGTLLELGDLGAAEVPLARCEQLAARLRSPYFELSPTGFRAGRLMLEGQLEAAEALATTRLAGSDLPRFAAGVLAPVLVGMVRREQGRLGELLPVLARIADERPYLGVVRVGHLLALLEAGQEAAARAGFEALARGRFAALVGGESWVFGLALLSEVCVALEDDERAATLAEILAPRARHCVVAANGFYCHGPVALYLGQLACTMRDWERAEAWLEIAVERAEALRSPVWRAHALAATARLHLGRGGPGAKACGRAKAREAAQTAARLGMGRLVRELRGLGA